MTFEPLPRTSRVGGGAVADEAARRSARIVVWTMLLDGANILQATQRKCPKIARFVGVAVCSLRTSAALRKMHGNGIVGILRESKNKWERRSPLSPADVRVLIADYGLRVLVQPSSRRIFADAEFEAAGAELVEDLAPCGTILAVKEVPVAALLGDRTYMCFSHTHKAQQANMPLLDALLQRRVRLIDYELVTEDGSRGAQRLVAFGRFAGIAGAVDFMRGLGERLLARGFTTPFLHVAAMYTYRDIAAAFAAVRACGAAIAEHGLPEAVGPLTVVVTGGGKVAGGCLEVWSLLPVRLASPFELRDVVGSAQGRARTHVVYLAQATVEHMVRRRPEAAATVEGEDVIPDDVEVDVATLDKVLYKAHPELFEPVFHIKILPWASVVCVCNYFEERFPRLLTVKQTRLLDAAGRLRLVGLCDISCDFKGSIEWGRRFTSIERPFLVYEPAVDAFHDSVDFETPRAHALSSAFESRGVLFHAVDHLPSECPRDASEYFSSALMPFVPLVARCPGGASVPIEQQMRMLPPPLAGAVLCLNGVLAPQYTYIASLREAAAKADAGRDLRRARIESFVTVRLVGHLFDKRVVNDALDAVELRGASAHILDFSLGRDRTAPTEMRLQLLSSVANGGAPLDRLPAVLEDLRRITAEAGASLTVESSSSDAAGASPPPSLPLLEAQTTLHAGVTPARAPRRVLVLGAGFVAAPCVDFLLRDAANHLTLVSYIAGEAEAIAGCRGARITSLQLDVGAEASKVGGGMLRALVREHDIVVSLVPAPLHAAIARLAIAEHTNLVTASYVSPEMAALDASARAAGVVLLNECGLDPGIDHMGVCRMVDALNARGAVITDFVSACGGLPAPEAADNPLGYKWSWSPRGALSAMMNGARYRDAGAEVAVRPGELLASAAPFRLHSLPAFALEALPNRDSLAYVAKYGLDDAGLLRSMRRSTLRYAGFSARLQMVARAGLLSADAAPLPAAIAAGATAVPLRELLGALLATEPGAPLSVLSTAAFALGQQALDVRDAEEFLEWLGLDDPVTLIKSAEGALLPLDTIAGFLARHPRMALRPGELDMVAMQHDLRAELPDGSVEQHSATLLEFGRRDRDGVVTTAMARTVGLTAGAAAALLLSGAFAGHAGGVFTPTTRDFYTPILDALQQEGVEMRESMRVSRPAK